MDSRGDILRQTLDELGVSKSELARRLVGKNADRERIGNKRRQVTEWTKPQGGFNDLTAERLTKALRLEDDRLRVAARRRRRARLEEQVAAIAALVVPLAREQGLEIPSVLLEDGE